MHKCGQGQASAAAVGLEELNDDVARDFVRRPRDDPNLHTPTYTIPEVYKRGRMAAEMTLHRDAIAVRIEVPETGWATSAAVVSTLGELGVRCLSVDRGGVRAIAVPSDLAQWTARFGELTRRLDELATVELRDDVAVLVGDAPADAVVQLQRWHASLTAADVPLRGAFAGSSEICIVVDRWRADAAKAAVSP